LYQLLEQVIVSGGPTIVIPYLGLLIFGIILAVIGYIGPRIAPEGGRIWTVIFWIGILLIIIWVILFLISLCC